MKELFQETDVVKNIVDVQFSILSSSEIQQVSHVEIYKNDYYVGGSSTAPSPNGVLDTRMGTSQKTVQCTTCSKSSQDCVGHFGYIDLERPVFHVGFFKNVLHLLQNICKRCSHILLKPADKKILSDQAKRVSKSKSFLQKKALYKRVNDLCKKVTLCPNCGFQNGVVKKVPPLKIIHEQFRNSKPGDVNLAKFNATFNHAIESNKDLEVMLPANPVEYIQPRDAFNLFKEIPSDHLPLFCMDSDFAHPTDLIIWRLPAAPNCIRPSVVSDLKAGTNEDDISQMYVDIIFLNNTLKKKMSSTTESSMDTWECMQITSAYLMNAELNVPNDVGLKRKNTRGFVQRLKGKQGRFRGNLSGKRVDFSSRTVISPDPNLRINEVGVPEEVAKKLTYPEFVTPHNINIMRELVKNGPDVHPGAIYVEQRRFPGNKKSLKYVNRNRMASELRYGDVIERHLMDGDIVLFNRQPSLHKMSIMCHQVKVLPCRTFRFNECVCTPYNADFDGDEMNLHVPQTEEARSEALFLMGVKSNLVTPRHGALIIGATQDFLTGSYLLTQKNQFFSRERAMDLISSVLCGKECGFKFQLPPPAIMKPVQLWTGKQIFSTVLCPYKGNKSKDNFPFPSCNLITKRKEYTKGEELCQREGWIIFRNSELLAGVLDKGVLGSGSKKNLFYVIIKDFGKDKAADAMFRVGRLTTEYLTNTGFSIGIGDVLPGKTLLERKKQLLSGGYSKCNMYIDQLRTGDLQSQPGCTGEETLEAVILKELSNIRDNAGKECVNELHKSNVPLVMAISGSKGSFINISQMIACVGQQAVSGKRVTNGFDNRALPHFERFSKIPAARGFVSNSFFSGITPTEFFFHTMAGREGLVDTAVKTAETGYMQRRLVKSLEDLYVAYDMTVRNSTQDVIQFSYGGDGLDPSELEDMDGPLDFERALNHVKALNPYPNEDPLSGTDIVTLTKGYFDDCKEFNALPPEFKESILKFMSNYGKVIDKKRSMLPIKEERSKVAGKTSAIDYVERLTFSQVIAFLCTCLNRYQSSIMEPGTAVGALCAQSIGEPGTQMTLKTFHFAGVAAMNITLGVPRILEIINASRTISTPIIEAKLKCDTDPEIARQVKGRVEKTLLGEVCEYIEENFLPDDCFLLLVLATERIKLLKLEVSAETIKYSIATSKLKIKEVDITALSPKMLAIRPPRTKASATFYHMQYIKQHIRQVVIKGLPSVSRAIINQVDTVAIPRYSLIIEGDNLREVIATYGIEGTKCTSNNTYEVFTTLGIEAARSTIIREITTTMETHGLSVDHRHVMLLADLMTCRGQVLGITRHGLSKMKESVLMLASFEKTADHLFDAAYYGQNNPITGVSDCIIMGKPMNIGTGVFKLLHKHEKLNNKALKTNKLDLIFDHPEFHVPLAQSGYV